MNGVHLSPRLENRGPKRNVLAVALAPGGSPFTLCALTSPSSANQRLTLPAMEPITPCELKPLVDRGASTLKRRKEYQTNNSPLGVFSPLLEEEGAAKDLDQYAAIGVA